MIESFPAARLGSLVEHATAAAPLYYRKGEREIVGLGVYRRFTASGPNRFAELNRQWTELLATVEPRVRESLVALGSGTFDPAAEARLIVPRTTIVRHGRTVTVVSWGEDAPEPVRRTVGAAPVVEWEPRQSVFRERVDVALARLDDEFRKVVVARAIVGTVTQLGDERAPLVSLSSNYADCHIFAVEGLWGASPETLVSVDNRRVFARVLAGSAARGSDPASDQRAARELADSAKDRDEHDYAVRSVVGALRQHCRSIVGALTPFTLRLPNLWHLASDVEGVLATNTSVLSIIDSLHPTAAVAGVPTDRALQTIAEVEVFPRERYAGPVGWVDGAGNGEFAIALRCAQWNDGGIIAHAGAGIVAGSQPDSEFAETELKFRPIRSALGDA
ncbi:isochorismate synthase [Microbacteriaceae bacterium MWH-Ta3]|nr:isochorismate synthase [Microbacteriaceae bacterium MWH-Ta3]